MKFLENFVGIVRRVSIVIGKKGLFRVFELAFFFLVAFFKLSLGVIVERM